MYKIPAHLEDQRYGVTYRNKEIEREIVATTAEEQDEALMDVVFHGLFKDGSTAEIISVRAGYVYDRMTEIRPGSVRNRAKTYLDLSSPERIGRLLTRWVTDRGGVCSDFSLVAYTLPNRGKGNYYDFVRNPTDSDYDIRNRKLRKILEEIKRRAQEREEASKEAAQASE